MELGKKRSFFQTISTQKVLILMVLPFFIHLIVFRYIPILGSVMAFQDYKPRLGISESPWVGFKHFIRLFNQRIFYETLRNTLAMALMKLVTVTLGSITLAVFLNETKNKLFKTSVQTITTLPNFIAWTVAASLVIEALSPSSGIINEVYKFFNPESGGILFMGTPEYFWWISTLSNLWKTIGWSAIIYLAAMTGIDQQLYEAAKIDGANRMQRIWHITLPGIKPTITILLIMSIGYMMNGGFEQQLLLKNGLNQSHAMVFEIFELQYGFQKQNYSFGTAAGLFRSLISFVLITFANTFSKKMGGDTII